VNAVGGAHVSVSTHSSPPSGFALLGQMKIWHVDTTVIKLIDGAE
jgi:hypothetical protein